MLQITGSVRSPAEGVEARGEINTLFNCVDFSLLSSWYSFLYFSVWFGRGPDFRIWPNLCLESHSVETTIKWFQFCVVGVSPSQVFTLTTNSFLLTEHNFCFKLQVCFARFQMENEGPDLQNYKISKRWAKLADSKYSTVKANKITTDVFAKNIFSRTFQKGCGWDNCKGF